MDKLKQLEEFKSCSSIADFGKVAAKYRFGENKTANWRMFDGILY